jgi:hypothetical protein
VTLPLVQSSNVFLCSSVISNALAGFHMPLITS